MLAESFRARRRLWGWMERTQAELYEPSVCVGGKMEPSGCRWGRPEQRFGDNSDEWCCHGVQVFGLHTSKYGSWWGGTTTTLYPSTREEGKDRQDKRRQNGDVLKMHRSQKRSQKPFSGLMKHMAKGSREESKSHCWQGRSDRVMWEWILCKWHGLPFCGFWIMKNSKKINK